MEYNFDIYMEINIKYYIPMGKCIYDFIFVLAKSKQLFSPGFNFQ